MNVIINPKESIAAVIDGEEFSIRAGHPSFNEVLKAIAEGRPEAEIKELFQPAKAVASYSDGRIEVKDGALSFDGDEVHSVVSDRIIEFMEQGLPSAPLVAFLKRLQANPSRRAVQELYTFLEHQNLPITDIGTFLAYKGVNNDYTDLHTGKYVNSPGASFTMLRNLVDDDLRKACSNGFHVGSKEYATGFGPRTVIVEVDPADVVSVPLDCDCQKLRTCRYTVVQDYQGPLNRPVYAQEEDDDLYAEDDVDVTETEESREAIIDRIRELFSKLDR